MCGRATGTHRPTISGPSLQNGDTPLQSGRPTTCSRCCPKLLANPATWDDRCVDTGGQVEGWPIVSWKRLSGDDPSCRLLRRAAVSPIRVRVGWTCAHGGDRCSQTGNRAVHILQSAEHQSAHQGERRGGEQRVHFALQCVLVSPPLVSGQTKLLLELLRISMEKLRQ